jgi:ABC-type nitrate/sulfonate/bicarbonate transport system substrate-binding protein
MQIKRIRQITGIAIIAISVVLFIFATGCSQTGKTANDIGSQAQDTGNGAKAETQNPTGTKNLETQNPAGTQNLITIKANVNKDCAGTPWFVGVQKGYYLANGIDFQDQGHLDWSLQPAALISGQTNVADAHPNTIINLLENGAKVKGVVASGYEPSKENIMKHHMHWLVLNSSSYHTIQDLVAKGHKPKIAVGSLGICADLENNAWFRQHNLTKDSFEYTIVPDPQQEEALRQGLIDVAVLHPPFYTAAEAHGGVRVIETSYDTLPSDKNGSVAGLSLLYFTDDFIKNHPDDVRKFIKAFKEAERWSNDHPNESGELTAKDIGLSTANAH